MGSVLSATNSFQPWISLRCVTENSDSPFSKSTCRERVEHKVTGGPVNGKEPKSQNPHSGGQPLAHRTRKMGCPQGAGDLLQGPKQQEQREKEKAQPHSFSVSLHSHPTITPEETTPGLNFNKHTCRMKTQKQMFLGAGEQALGI